MFGNSLFGKSLDISSRILGADALRKETIANNIANVDTPHYKRQMVSFESQLIRALESEKSPEVPTKVSDNRHIHFSPRIDPDGVRSRVQVEFDSNYRNDKNNVDIEKEMSDEVKNTLHYQAVTGAISNSLRRIRSAMNLQA